LVFDIIFNMYYDDVFRKLKQFQVEEIIWIIYIVIIGLSFYSNKLERRYFVNNDSCSKEKYRKIMILIFSILIFVYLYFVKDAYYDLKNISPFDSEKKKELVFLSFLGSLFIAISGFLFLYIAILDDELDVELAFN